MESLQPDLEFLNTLKRHRIALERLAGQIQNLPISRATQARVHLEGGLLERLGLAFRQVLVDVDKAS